MKALTAWQAGESASHFCTAVAWLNSAPRKSTRVHLFPGMLAKQNAQFIVDNYALENMNEELGTAHARICL